MAAPNANKKDPNAPDVIVAIDLGMTYTGVGWSRPTSSSVVQSPIQIVHNWPGSLSMNEQKVKTRVAYTPAGHLSSWGYLCDEERTPDAIHKEFFKIFLDQATVDRAQREGLVGAPASAAEAERLVADYLRQVYAHVRSTLEVQMGGGDAGWREMVIEFLFSVPTTWRTHDIINAFKRTIRDAGFGLDGPRHQALVELTESEAAAVATIKAASVRFRKNDVFIVVDAGGGTTDCSVMQVLDAGGPFPKLAQVAEVDGVGIGSTLIDVAFGAIVRQRLAAFPDLAAFLPADCADALLRSEAFKRMKHRFGEPTFTADVYELPMDGVGFTFSYPPAGIERGKMLFSREQVQELFDSHIEKVLDKVRDQLDWSESNLAGQQVNYMILSGGLGSSKYVHDRIEQTLQRSPHPAATAIQILQAPDPQLVVVKGLLLDRLQRIDSGQQPVLVQRRARSSYGVLTERLFNPALHAGATVKRDPYDGKLYAVGLISWLIRKGDVVNPDAPVARRFFRYIENTVNLPSWDSFIVQSNQPSDALPTFVDEDGVKKLCKVTSNLNGVRDNELPSRRRPSRSLFHRGDKYFVCEYNIKAIVAPADLRFEVWFRGKKFSGNHEPIRVEWEDSPGSGEPPF